MISDTRQGILLMTFSMLGFAAADALIKASSGAMTSGQIVLALGIGGTILFSIICIAKGQAPFSSNFFDRAVVVRSIGESFGSVGIITSIAYIPISTVSAIQQATPLVVTLGAVLFFNESVGWRRWLAIVIGFFCVMLIIRPGMDAFNPYALLALLGMFGLSVRDLATRPVKNSISTMQLSVYGYLVLIPAGIVVSLIMGTEILPPFTALGHAAIILCFSALGYVAITQSMRIAPLSDVAPFRYSRLLFALFFGIVFFGERPDWQTYLGSFGIIMSGLVLIWREKRS
ncbi:membrane protein [Amylibacter ulvae]|uniref:Membrane protein n=1 Tax=Paramylibacter ulvae TaxID=1651968 RepID=A0ABQ3CZD4_9RHOB|nr:DMT family transporter [Amylibacter ulvae]GHA45818.1 membrane protein [Amylibacter ulvae]